MITMPLSFIPPETTGDLTDPPPFPPVIISQPQPLEVDDW